MHEADPPAVSYPHLLFITSRPQYRHRSVAWAVQLSDLHISKFVHRDIATDLLQFGDKVLSSIKPGSLLITGDLVDAKVRSEGSKQWPEEWQAYEVVWQALAEAAGLPPSAVLDLRGNHDVFDTLRNTGQDLFSFHSATAAAHGGEAAASNRMSSSSQGLGFFFVRGLLLRLPADLPLHWVLEGHLPDSARSSLPGQPGDGSTSWQYRGEEVLGGSGWVWLGAADCRIITSLFVVLVLLPLTIWVGLAEPDNSKSGARWLRFNDSGQPAAGITYVEGYQ
eukprot:gene8125-8319_t